MKKFFTHMLLPICIGAAFGAIFTAVLSRIVQQMEAPDTGEYIFCMCILLFITLGSYLLHTIIHEAGHLVFGKISGYRFSSFRIANLILMRQGDHLRFKKMHLAGTGGQCLMSPPKDTSEKKPFVLYNLGGILMNLIAALISILCFIPCRDHIWGSTFFLVFAIIGILGALLNGIPSSISGIANDGKNTLILLHSPAAVEAFYNQLRINELQGLGVRLKDMPEIWFDISGDSVSDNHILTSSQVLYTNRLLDQHHYSEALQMMEKILEENNHLLSLYRFLLINDCIFLRLLPDSMLLKTENPLTDPETAYQEKQYASFCSQMKNFPSILRTRYAYLLLHDQNSEKAEETMNQFRKIAADYPYPSEINSELEFIHLAQSCAESME